MNGKLQVGVAGSGGTEKDPVSNPRERSDKTERSCLAWVSVTRGTPKRDVSGGWTCLMGLTAG